MAWRKRIVPILAALALAGALIGLALFERFIGFPGARLERSLPSDTLAFAGVDTLRWTALRLSLDEEAMAALEALKAVALSISDAAKADPTAPSWPELDPSLARSAAEPFKTRLGIAALAPPADAPAGAPNIVFLARFHGDADRFFENVVALVEPLRESGIVGACETEFWQGYILRALPLPGGAAGRRSIAWTVWDRTFFAALGSDALKRILALQPAIAAGECLADRPELQDGARFVGDSDISLFVDIGRAAPLAASWADGYLRSREDAPLLRTVSATRFAEALGLFELRSLRFDAELLGDRRAYAGVRYRERKGLLAALELDQPDMEIPDTRAVATAAALSLDAGEALRISKDAALRGAPLAVFPYIGWTSRFSKRTRLTFDKVLQDGFAPGLRYSAALALAEDERPSMWIDHELSLKLADEAVVKAALDAYRHDLAAALGRRLNVAAIDGGEASFLDAGGAAESGRIGFFLRVGELVIGYGRLEGFGAARAPGRPVPSLGASPEGSAVGRGYGDFRAFPGNARRIAFAFYAALNPGKPIPEPLLRFDWERLAPLSIERASEFRDDGSGHLYGVSRQLR